MCIHVAAPGHFGVDLARAFEPNKVVVTGRVLQKSVSALSTHLTGPADDEEQHAEAASLAAAKDSLEPQASTKATEDMRKLAARGAAFRPDTCLAPAQDIQEYHPSRVASKEMRRSSLHGF